MSNVQVTCLVRKAKKNKNFLNELKQAQETKAADVDLVKSIVMDMNTKQEVIDSVEYVTKAIDRRSHMSIKPWYVKKVMKQE